MRKIIFSFIIILLNFSFVINSQAFLYWAIYSLNSINIAKANWIELSPPYNSRTYCLISQRKYNHYFKDYIRSTCFQKEDDNNSFYYLICPNSFSDCNVSKYLWAALNEEELNWNIWNNKNISKCGWFDDKCWNFTVVNSKQNTITRDDIVNKVKDIFELQKNTAFSSDVDSRLYNVLNNIEWIIEKNNPSTNKKLYEFLDNIYKKYSWQANLDINKIYTIESMIFTDTINWDTFTLKDLLSNNVWVKDINKVYNVTLVVRDYFWIRYNVNLKFDKNFSFSWKYIKTPWNDYNIEEIINWVFMDDNWNEYNIEDVIKNIFEENNNSTPEYYNSWTTDPNTSSVDSWDKELSLEEIMNMVFKEE